MDTPPAEDSKKLLLLRGSSVVMAFSAGVVAHALWARFQAGSEVVGGHGTPASATDLLPPRMAAMSQRAGEADARSEDNAARWLRLKPEVVDALLTGGGLDRKLGLMGLTAEQIAIVTRIQDQATAALKRIEKEHATVVSDERGDFVVISPFPEAKRAWLNQIEEKLREKLREMVGDDRASVISRMIAFSDNDEAVGSGRREIFIIDPPAPGLKLRIEERTFNDAGEHIDTDYELVTERSQGRWGHVLDFKQE